VSRFDRRKAERFVEFIDTASGPRTHRRTAFDDELLPLVHAVRSLRDLPATAAAPNDEFRGALRSFLVATAERDGLGATASRRTRSAAATAQDTAAWQAIKPLSALGAKTQPVRQLGARGPGRTRIAVLAGVAAGAIILSGVSAASTGALPGDTLYPVKRSTEQAQLALAGSDDSRGKLYLEFSRSRLAEAEQVDPDRVRPVLADMNNETRLGVSLVLQSAVASRDVGGLAAVTTFVQQQRTALAGLHSRLPQASADQTVQPALELLDQITERINGLNHALTAGCPIPNVDALGPQPAANC
jgi:hypothetical protein